MIEISQNNIAIPYLNVIDLLNQYYVGKYVKILKIENRRTKWYFQTVNFERVKDMEIDVFSLEFILKKVKHIEKGKNKEYYLIFEDDTYLLLR